MHKWKRRKGGKKETGKIFEVAMAEDVPKSISDMKAHIQEAQKTPSRINNNNNTSALGISYSKCRKSKRKEP